MLFIFAGLTLSILIQGLADTNSLFYESRHSICSLLIVACASLLINSRLKNPFVDLLNLLFFIFFILRAVTSLFIETQVDPIIARASASDLSGAIYFLNGCFVVLIFAVHIFSLNVDHRRVILSDLEKETVSWAIRISSIFILIDSSWAIYSFFNCLELNFLHSVSIYAIFKNIFLSAQSLLFLVALPIYYVDQIRRIDFGIIFISLAIFLIGNILSGGKSGVLLVALYFIIGIILGFRLYGSSYLRTHWRKILSISILLVALAPVAFTLGKAMRVIILGNFGCGSVAERSHSISSWKRAINGKAHELKAYFGARNAEISVGESSAKISVGESNKIAGASDFKLSQTLNAISGRTGFFDY
jgi:hypothetical protein